MSNLQRIEQIRDGWSTDGVQGLARLQVYIGVQIELAIEAFEEIVTASEQILGSPPSYNQTPDERHQRLIELHVLSQRAEAFSSGLQSLVKLVYGIVNNPIDTIVEEMQWRVLSLEGDVKQMKAATEIAKSQSREA